MAKKNHADTIIIGGGLSGLVAAAYLEKAQQNYILFEAQDEFGGLVRGQNHNGVWLDYGIKSIPVGDINENVLLKIKKDLDLKFNIETVIEPALALTKAGFAAFVGLGDSVDKKIAHEITYYLESPRILVSNGWKMLLDELSAIIPEEKRKAKSHVTKVEVEEDKVVAVIINSDTRYTGENFIFTLSPTALPSLVPMASFSPKAAQKVAKTEALTSISIDIATARRISPLKCILVLREDGFVVVGQFISNSDPLKQSDGLQISSWMTLMDKESAADDEAVSKTLKNMKKLIKKAFPQLVEDHQWERIIVAHDSHGGNLNITQQISNLFLCGGQYADGLPYITSAIRSAQKASAEITTRQASIAEKNMFEEVGL